MYAEVDSIINEELPMLYTHSLTLLEAGSMNLKGYQPALVVPLARKARGFGQPG